MAEPAPSEHAWSSSLSTNDFAACLASGLRPLGFVQGCSVVSWVFYGAPFSSTGFGIAPSQQLSGYFEQFDCPHGFVSVEHRIAGYNYEQSWLEDAWNTAYASALKRLVDEARSLDAHGVIAIVERAEHHGDLSAFELSLSGTAVAVDGGDPPDVPFTTFLAGQKLNKLVEAGFAPVSIAQSFVSIGVYESCVTEYQTRGGVTWNYGLAPTGEIDQLSRAQTAARMFAREVIRKQLSGDVLHAAILTARDHESQGGPQFEVSIRGNRVRRFKNYEELPPPRPVVRLVDR